MGGELRFDGRVVLITGAGQGLGREYALQFAERGASVVVNDLGGSFKGEGQSSRVADKVVEEIRAKGGKAVANYDSVENGDKLVETAINAFGRIDIVINNAGILRDKSFARISDLDWDLIQKVHLKGAFAVSRAAFPYMKKQNFGRFIMTSSTSGIYGNFGQANYSAAKLGLVGLSNTLSIEGAKYNIKCNSIAPQAGSRLTATVLPPDLLKALKPEYVAPLVLYLCHEDTDTTGGIFEVGAGWVGQLRWERTQGAVCRTGTETMTPESGWLGEVKVSCMFWHGGNSKRLAYRWARPAVLAAVRDNWHKITDFTDSVNPKDGKGTMTMIMGILGDLDNDGSRGTSSSSSTKDIDPELAKAAKFKPTKFEYGPREAILYALGVGYTTQDEDYLKFLFEGSPDFCVIPSFAVIPAQSASTGIFTGGIPGLKIDPTKILHGEQYIEVLKPFEPSGTLTSQGRVADVLDKGSGCVILIEVDTYNEKKEKVAFNQFATFVVGAGNFGGKRSSDSIIPTADPPKRSPDATMSQKTSIDQAALYRLTGDRNPLHIDPSFAAMGGFKQPILHGMSTYGFALRHVLKTFANNDVTKIKCIKARFAKPVLPGQTLQTDMWKDGNRIYYQCKVVENGNVCLSGAYIDLYAGATQSTSISESSGPKLQSDTVFEQISEGLKSRPGLAKKINAIFQWIITVGGKTASEWTVDFKTGEGAIYRGKPKSGKADCTLTLSDEVLIGLATGKLNAQNAFMQGKLKLAGNIMLAQKLGVLFQEQAKL